MIKFPLNSHPFSKVLPTFVKGGRRGFPPFVVLPFEKGEL